MQTLQFFDDSTAQKLSYTELCTFLLNTLYKYVKTKILLFNIWLLARAFMIWLTLKLKALTLSYTASVSAPNTNKFVKLSLNIFYFILNSFYFWI